jgi:hypothetical protein
MPYSGISDPALPKNVRSLSSVRKRQWLHVYESEKAKGASDADAIIRANGVIKKQMGRSMAAGKSDAEFSTDMPIVLGLEGIFEGEIDAGLEENLLRIEAGQECGGYGYESDWVNKVTREEANYQVLGGTSDRACANCRWFLMNAHACQVVGGTIYHTGVSDRYEAVPVSEPYVQPVTIVDSSTDPQAETSERGIGKLARNAYESILSFFGLEELATPAAWKEERPSVGIVAPSGAALSLHEGTGEEPGLLYTPPGRVRYWAVASNNFFDNKGLEFPANAQQEYVDWVWSNPEKHMPELQGWHTPGTRLGQSDWIDFDGHFLHSTGLIDVGREEIARDLANDPEMAMSHGYVVVWDRHSRAKVFRSYEQSVLPRQSAGNSFTSFGLEEDNVAFSEPRKKFLRERFGLSDDEINARETRWEQFGGLLEKLGIGFHELELYVASVHADDEGGAPEGQAATPPAADAAATPPAAAAPAPAAAAAPAPTAASSEGGQLATEAMTPESLAALIGSVFDAKMQPLAQAVHGLQEHQNRVEQLLPNARPAPQAGYDATKGANNTPTLIQTPTGGVALGQQSKEGVPAEPLPPAVLAAIAAGAQENGGSLESPIAWLQKKLEGGHPLLNGTAPEVRG